MRYAIISDIHGNLPAFNAVLDDAKKKDVDSYIFLGDYCFNLPYPNETISVLKNLKHAFVVSGNEEHHIVNLEKQDQNSWKKGQFDALYSSYLNLFEENKKYLKNLPDKLKISDSFADIYTFHSVASYFKDTIITELKSSSYAIATEKIQAKEYITGFKNRLDEDNDFQNTLSKLPNGIYAYGHNHLQTHFKFGNKLLINPGSCGIPLDCPGRAPYTILETSNNGWYVEELRVAYDLKGAIEFYRNSDLYHNAKVWCNIIIKELIEGKEKVMFFLDFTEKYAKSKNSSVRPYSQEIWEEAYEIWSKQN